MGILHSIIWDVPTDDEHPNGGTTRTESGNRMGQTICHTTRCTIYTVHPMGHTMICDDEGQNSEPYLVGPWVVSHTMVRYMGLLADYGTWSTSWKTANWASYRNLGIPCNIPQGAEQQPYTAAPVATAEGEGSGDSPARNCDTAVVVFYSIRHPAGLGKHAQHWHWIDKVVTTNSRFVIYLVYIIKIKMHSSCEIEYFVETHLCKLCVILRSRVLRVVCPY